jgi:hypothetical protein
MNISWPHCIIYSLLLFPLPATESQSEIRRHQGRYSLTDESGFIDVGQKSKKTSWARCSSTAEGLLDKFRGSIDISVAASSLSVNGEAWELTSNSTTVVAGVTPSREATSYILGLHLEHRSKGITGWLTYFGIDEKKAPHCATAIRLNGSFQAK